MGIECVRRWKYERSSVRSFGHGFDAFFDRPRCLETAACRKLSLPLDVVSIIVSGVVYWVTVRLGQHHRRSKTRNLHLADITATPRRLAPQLEGRSRRHPGSEISAAQCQ